MRNLRSKLLMTLPLGILAALPLTPGARAADPTDTVPEVTVTALRQNQSVLNTSASVTVIDAATLETADVHRPEDIVAMTPGVSVVSNTAEAGDIQVNIRGINGARDAEASFAFVIDGILISNPAAFAREFVDLDQIEVLKGPQGALYGRNAAAGAIVVTTRKPTNDFETTFKTTFAGNNTERVIGSSSGPIIPDQLWIRLSADYSNTNGFYTNSFTDQKSVDEYSDYNINARVIWDPAPGTEFDLKGRVGHIDAAAIAFNAVFELPGLATAFGNPYLYENANTHSFDYVNNVKPEDTQDTRELSLKYTHSFDGMDLTAWTLFSQNNNAFLSDGTAATFGFYNQVNSVTGTNVCQASLNSLAAQNFKYPTPQSPFLLGPYTASTCDGYQYQIRNQTDYSGEVRLTSTGNSDLHWSGGLYYLHIDRQVGVAIGDDLGLGIVKSLYDPIGSTSPTAQLYNDGYTTNVYAAFGSVTYNIADNLELLGAFRFDVEARDTTNLDPVGATQPFVALPGVAAGTQSPLNPGLVTYPNGIPSRSKVFDQPEPRISVRYKPDENLTLYGAYGVGFKSGGFNAAGSAATVAALAADTAFANPVGSDVKISDDYKKETSNAFEVGFKGRSGDRKFTYEGAAFYTMVDNMQYFEFFSGPNGLLRVVDNIDRVDLRGFELGSQYRPISWLSFNAGFEYVNSEILKNATRPNTVGNKSPYTPDYTASLAAQVTQPITDDLRFFTRIDTNLIGNTWFSTVQNQTVPSLFGPANFSQTERAAYTTSNIRIGVQGDHYGLSVFSTNAFNAHYLSEVIPAPEFGGAFVAQGPGRLIGVEGTYTF